MLARKLWITGVMICMTTGLFAKQPKTAPFPPLTPEQSALVEKAVAREKITVKQIQARAPIVQTYIQNMRSDAELYAVPTSDQFILSRVDFGRTFNAKEYQQHSGRGLFKGSVQAVAGLTKAFHFSREYQSTGFMDMMFVDPIGFDQQHYDFSYVRREFLGSVRAVVFDVRPKPDVKDRGRFTGRVWVEDQDGNIVRFNGTYTGSSDGSGDQYFHFDSWRNNLQPDLWLPVAIYVEETANPNDKREYGFRAQTHFWGYSLKLPTRESDSESIQVENAVDASGNQQDVSPLQAQREWVSQAEQNVLDRLVQAGLLAAPSDFDKVLETVTNNLIIGNKLVLPGDIHCRVLLTSPLEALAVGNTILLSKGLVDVLPYEEDLAAVLSFELAHISLGHHIDTRYAFNDRLLFPDESTFQRIKMGHTASDDEEAAKKAVEYLNGSVYHDKLGNAGLFFAELVERAKLLPALVTPRLGDSLLSEQGEPWMAELSKQGPKLEVHKLDQIAALPLGSHLKTDPWDDKVYQLNVKAVPIINARDKMPLELTPLYMRLARYTPPVVGQPAVPPATGTMSVPQQENTAAAPQQQ